MFSELKKIPVFLKRDFQLLYSYRLAFSMSFLSTIFTLFYMVLFGSMFNSSEMSHLLPYGGDYISYIFVGTIGWSFFWTIMTTTSSSLSLEMMLGTLESILITPTKILTIMISYSLFGSFFGFITIGLLVSIGYFLFGITIFAYANIYTLIIIILSSIMMMGFGFIFGGLTIWLKRIGETIPLLQNIVMFFCGVYFPISVLPTFLQPVAKYIPFYYSIQGIRMSLIPDTPESEIYYFIGILLILSIIFMILGVFVLKRGLKKAKKEGSLSFY